MSGHLEQSDATAWMYAYCMSMLAMVTALARRDRRNTADLQTTFLERPCGSPRRSTSSGLWDDVDGFFYDALRLPDG